MFLLRGVGLAGEEDRSAAASYCGQKFGVTSADFQPCVNWYVQDKIGDYKPGGSSTPVAPTQAAANIVSTIFPSGGVSTNPLLPIVTPWYKTPIGILAILAAAFVGYKLVLKK